MVPLFVRKEAEMQVDQQYAPPLRTCSIYVDGINACNSGKWGAA